MTERPIPFSGEMVRAILKGDKTLTRRVMKPQPAPFVQSTPDRHPTTRTDPYIDAYCGERKTPENPRGMSRDWHWWTADNRLGRLVARCPYGAPGDLLWVREAWRAPLEYDGIPPSHIPPSVEVQYIADASAPWASRYRSPRFMPRWASRITLRITDVRVERLQEISHADVLAEGLLSAEAERAHDVTMNPKRSFGNLWNQINGAGAWEANPWVWVVAFERVKP